MRAYFFRAFLFSLLLSKVIYITGMKKSVNSVPTNKPPKRTIAIGRIISAPLAVDTAIGRYPRIDVKEVIRIGRILAFPE